MKLGFSQQEIIDTAKSLGLPSDGFVQRRVARAIDILDSNKVTEIDDGIFRVHSQYDENKSYIVNVNHGQPYCDCPDGERTINCKHRIASLLYAQKQSKARMLTIYDDMANSYHHRGRWIVTDHKARVKYIVHRESNGSLICPCGRKKDCEHRKAIREYLNNGGGNGTKRIKNECGSERAKQLQDKMNGQLDSRNNNGNGDAKSPSQLDLSDPFQQSEQNDIDQIEGRKNGELAWKIGDEFVISYRGIMRIAESHDIEFELATHDDTHTVIAKGRCGTSERVSGKPINGSMDTAMELAKRNAARQLLPLAEIKAVERKAKLNAEFDWQKAKAKCVELVGTEANVAIVIHHLTQAGKLRQDNPSHYNRTEWLLIHKACQEDATNNDGGDNSPPSPSLDPKSVNNWSYNSPEFIDKCREAIQKVRDDSAGVAVSNFPKVEANEMPLENGNGKRKIQMDKKLRTWLIDSDGTKKPISCREICMDFDSNIVTRLRAGIDSGADLSTVEID